jgi:anhydro-N-acetylmuramic acid kinase
LLETDGTTLGAVGPARTYPYAESDRDLLRAAVAAARGLTAREARPAPLAAAEDLVTRRHAEAVEAFLAEYGVTAGEIDIVGFHGQTVFHEPARALTVQIGDGAALARRLAIPVAWDFRAEDMAGGGQGAPLAPVFHRAVASAAGVDGPVAFLNLGGVANITYVAADGALLAFDTGPGNGLLDDWTRERTGRPFDEDGNLAAAGVASMDVLAELLAHEYFTLPPPKSLDRHAFTLARLSALSDADGAATLLHLSAHGVAAALRHLPIVPHACYACGGGRLNRALMQALATLVADMPVVPIETLGFDGDATEAQAFAFLAVRAADGMPLTYPATTGVRRPSSGGRVSLPVEVNLRSSNPPHF